MPRNYYLHVDNYASKIPNSSILNKLLDTIA